MTPAAQIAADARRRLEAAQAARHAAQRDHHARAQAAAVEAAALADAGCVVPNLDDMTTDPTDLHAASLVFGRLAAYADHKARAMEHRAGGDIDAARSFEAAAQAQYAKLPPWARW